MFQPLVGLKRGEEDESGPPKAMVVASFLPIFPSRMPGKIFRKNSDSLDQIRFTQRDPLGIKAGINQYAYVNANPVNFNDPDGLIANSISNAYTQTASYFSNNSYAAFGSGLAVGGAAGYGLGYGLAALSSACLPCGAVASVGLAGYGAYQLASNNFAGAQNIGNSFQIFWV